jgi:dTDP-4-amino-4,6-dideoxygalactose transaminase
MDTIVNPGVVDLDKKKNMRTINVTKTFLPPVEEYHAMLQRAWDKSWITNNGELVIELEEKLKKLLGVKHLFFTNNGTVVLQMALKAFNITKEVITTPFSYVATANAIAWEGCTPIFADINGDDFCIDPDKIIEAITENTQAILATHVYGHPCQVEKIQKIADDYNLKVIYDAAHSFGATYNGKALLSYGDISTCSFHATKLFHTGEGGCIITNDDAVAAKLQLYRQFGHLGDDYFAVGINAKSSELHAAMGLCNLKYIDEIMRLRKKQWLYYESNLIGTRLQLLPRAENPGYNFAYFPVVFSTTKIMMRIIEELKEANIFPRRYFYPSLSSLEYINKKTCPVSENIAERVICLPLFYDLKEEEQDLICEILLRNL